MAVLFFQVAYRFFEHPIQAMHLIVGRYHERHKDFCIGNLESFLARDEAVASHFFDSHVVIVPAGQRLRGRDLSFGRHGDILLLGFGRRARRGSEEPDECIELEKDGEPW